MMSSDSGCKVSGVSCRPSIDLVESSFCIDKKYGTTDAP